VTGALTQLPGRDGFLNSSGRLGCAVARGLTGAISVAVSPDGRHSYLAGEGIAVHWPRGGGARGRRAAQPRRRSKRVHGGAQGGRPPSRELRAGGLPALTHLRPLAPDALRTYRCEQRNRTRSGAAQHNKSAARGQAVAVGTRAARRPRRSPRLSPLPRSPTIATPFEPRHGGSGSLGARSGESAGDRERPATAIERPGHKCRAHVPPAKGGADDKTSAHRRRARLRAGPA
jgi:hypothetical protein